MLLQNEINELRAQNKRLNQSSSTGSHPLRIKMSEDLNLMNDLSDNEVDNLTFGSFHDFWNKVDDGTITSSDASEIQRSDSSNESLVTDGNGNNSFLSRIFARTKKILKLKWIFFLPMKPS